MYADLQRLMAVMSFGACRPEQVDDIQLGSLGWRIDEVLFRPNRDESPDATAFYSNGGQLAIASEGAGYGLPDVDGDIKIGAGLRSGETDRVIGFVANDELIFATN